MESLTSGVEPFILCAEFLNVGISKIAVMAALTVNLWCPCNTIPFRSSFHVLARRPAPGYWHSRLIQRGRQEGDHSSGALKTGGWELHGIAY